MLANNQKCGVGIAYNSNIGGIRKSGLWDLEGRRALHVEMRSYRYDRGEFAREFSSAKEERLKKFSQISNRQGE